MRRCVFTLVLIIKTFICFAQDSTQNQAKVWYKRTIIKTTAVPTVLIGYGLSIKEGNGLYSSYDSYRDIQSNWPKFHSKIDNVTQFVPAISVYGLNAIGVKGQNDVLHATYLYSSSLILSTLVVQGLKHSISEERPNGSSNTSFPSGHTATAFAAAEFMHQEYRKKSIWYSIAGYSIASFTGTMRMLNNKHWQSDVFVGAGIGMLSTKLSYFAFSHLKRKKRNYSKF